MNPDSSKPKPKFFPRPPARPAALPTDGAAAARRSHSGASEQPPPSSSASHSSSAYSRTSAVQQINTAVKGSAHATSIAQPQVSFTSAWLNSPTERSLHQPTPASPVQADATSLSLVSSQPISQQPSVDQVPSRLPLKSRARLSRSPSRLSSAGTSPSIASTGETAFTAASVSQPAADPVPFPRPAPSTAEQLLTSTLSRLLTIRTDAQEQHGTLSTSALEALFEDGEAKDSLRAWEEADSKKRAEARAAKETACRACAEDLMRALRCLVSETKDQGAGSSGLGGGARKRMRTGEHDDRSTAYSPSTGASSFPPNEDHHRIAELESQISSFQSQVEAQQASRNSHQADLDNLAEQVRAEVTATFESRIAELEARGSSSKSTSTTSVSTSPQASESPSPHYASTSAQPPFVTHTAFESYATKIHASVEEIESKGKILAARVGVEWTTSESVLGKRKLAGGAEVSSEVMGGEESAERRENLMESVIGLRHAGAEVLSRVESLETRSEGKDLQHTFRPTTDLAPMATSASESAGTDHSVPAEAFVMLSEADSALQDSIEVLKNEVGDLEQKAEESLNLVKRELGERDEKLERAIYEGDERLRVLTTYFATNNRLQSLDQPAIRIAIRDWKAANPPPPVVGGRSGEGAVPVA